MNYTILLSLLFLFSCTTHTIDQTTDSEIDSVLLSEPLYLDETHKSLTPTVEVKKYKGNLRTEFIEDKNYNSYSPPTPEPQHIESVDPSLVSDITLNFKSIDIVELAQIVLNDLLKEPYSIEEGIYGKVSIQTATPLNKKQLLNVITDLVESTGNQLNKKDGIYRLQKDTGNLSSKLNKTTSTSKTLVIPLRYISAEQARNLLEPYQDDAKISFDTVNQVVLIFGDKKVTDHLYNTISQFDISQMSKKSFLIAKIKNANTDDVVNELETIFKDINTNARAISFVSLPRINSLLVISKDHMQLTTAKNWITRLDVFNQNLKTVHSYSCMNKRASRLYELYSQILSTEKPSTVDAQDNDKTVQSSFIYNITFDDDTNTIHFYTDKKTFDEALPVLLSLDKPTRQVFIEATIIEVSLQGDLKNGLEWYFKNKVASGSVQTGFDVATEGLKLSVPSFSFGLVNVISGLNVLFQTIESNTKINVISSPSLVVLNNRTASINIGDKVPTLETVISDNDSDTTKQTITYRNTGVIMQITPQINNDKVIIKVRQELTDVATTTTSGIDAPTFKERIIDTTILVNQNQTIVLGGLIRGGSSFVDKHSPYAKTITNNEATTTNRTELLVMIKPTIINDANDVTNLTNNQKSLFKRIRESYN